MKITENGNSVGFLFKLLGGFLLLAGVVWLVGQVMGSEVDIAIRNFVKSGGLPVFFLVITGINIVLVPFSSDILIAVSPTIFPDSIPILFAMAIFSALLAAYIDIKLGKVLGAKFVEKFLGSKRYNETEILVEKYGIWAIGITAITPLPFSAVCWMCGALRLSPAKALIAVSVTRVPRHLIALFIGLYFPEWLNNV